MMNRWVCLLILLPALLLLFACALADMLGVPDTAPGHTWSTTG